MRIETQFNTASLSGSDAGSLAQALIGEHRIFGGADTRGLRDAVESLRQSSPRLAEEVEGQISTRLSITDAGEFEAAKPIATNPASHQAKNEAREPIKSESEPLNVRREIAYSMPVLRYNEASYRQAVADNGGPFSNSPEIEAAFEHNRQLLTAGIAQADAESGKLLFAGIGGPALAGLGAATAPIVGAAAGTQFVSPIAGQTAYYVASGTVGGTSSVAFEAAKNSAFDIESGPGGYIGAAAGGALGATGIKLLGDKAPKIANNVLLGGIAGGAGDRIGQNIDIGIGATSKPVNNGNTIAAAAFGSVVGAITPTEIRIGGLNAGRNNSVAIYNSLQTRAGNGSIDQFQLRYGVEGGVGQGVTGMGQGAISTTGMSVFQKASE